MRLGLSSSSSSWRAGKLADMRLPSGVLGVEAKRGLVRKKWGVLGSASSSEPKLEMEPRGFRTSTCRPPPRTMSASSSPNLDDREKAMDFSTSSGFGRKPKFQLADLVLVLDQDAVPRPVRGRLLRLPAPATPPCGSGSLEERRGPRTQSPCRRGGRMWSCRRSRGRRPRGARPAGGAVRGGRGRRGGGSCAAACTQTWPCRKVMG